MASMENTRESSGVVMHHISRTVGIVGAVAVFAGGFATFFSIPFIGKVLCLYCPTGSGILYIALAIISIAVTYLDKVKLLYLTGGLIGILILWDVYSASSIGYIMQMIFSGKMSSGSGGVGDPIITSMLSSGGFEISTGWLTLAAGCFLLIMAPQLEIEEGTTQKSSKREKNLNERMNELQNLANMYHKGDLSKEEFGVLKDELVGPLMRRQK